MNKSALPALLLLASCQHPPAAEATPPPVVTRADLLDLIPQTAEAAAQSVVSISVSRTRSVTSMTPMLSDPMLRRFFGDLHGAPLQRQEQGMGSGVIVDGDGVILTNAHVIEDADDLKVTLRDGRSYQAEVVGTDTPSDIAVLRLLEPPDDLVPVVLGDSGSLRLGEVVLAIGNPFGIGQTVTMGIISATGKTNVGISDYEEFIQTDAAINPGNSGGALVNVRGELIGINTAIYSRSGGYQGIGFAIPTHMAQRIMESLLEDGSVERGWLGVAIQTVDGDLAESLKRKTPGGVLISEVTPSSPADDAGLQPGDIVTGFNGEDIDSAAQLRNAVALAGAGAGFTVEILRGGRQRALTGTLGERPPEVLAADAPDQPESPWSLRGER